MRSDDFPRETQATLVRAFGENLDQAALEALAIEGYRIGRRQGDLCEGFVGRGGVFGCPAGGI